MGMTRPTRQFNDLECQITFPFQPMSLCEQTNILINQVIPTAPCGYQQHCGECTVAPIAINVECSTLCRLRSRLDMEVFVAPEVSSFKPCSQVYHLYLVQIAATMVTADEYVASRCIRKVFDRQILRHSEFILMCSCVSTAHVRKLLRGGVSTDGSRVRLKEKNRGTGNKGGETWEFFERRSRREP